MPDQKISELGAASGLAAGDLFVVVQSATSKKADVSLVELPANKSTDSVTDRSSNTKYPSVKAAADYADKSISQSTASSAVGNGTTGTVSPVMCGFAGSITPSRTGRVLFTISGSVTNNTANDGILCRLRYGTGTAPVNGAAATGTVIGGTCYRTVGNANALNPGLLTAIVTGLTVGTTYWFDSDQIAVVGGTAFWFGTVSLTGVEL